jgi:hypothetical protein
VFNFADYDIVMVMESDCVDHGIVMAMESQNGNLENCIRFCKTEIQQSLHCDK